MKTICVLGLAYVRLPLATVFADAGFTLTGIDPDQRNTKSMS